MTEKTSINKELAPCVSDPEYSFNSCVMSYIAKLTVCTLDFFDFPKGFNFPPCSTREQLLRYEEEMVRLIAAPWRNLTAESGCYTSCTVKKFQLTKTKEELVTWKRTWSSAFYMTAESTLVRKEEEFLVFDKSDLINGIGGAMGLFLGWSLLSLIQKFASSSARLFQYIYEKI